MLFRSDEDKEFILKTMEGAIDLKSKVELINNFIESTIVPAEGELDVEGELYDYLDRAKSNAILNLAIEDNLKEENLVKIIHDYEFSGKIKNDAVKESFDKDLTFLEKQSLVTKVKNNIINLIEQFTW